MILGINKTVAANLMKEPQTYIEFKLKYVEELLSKYKEWYSGIRYSSDDQKQKANIAAMALIMSDVMQFGFDEQVIMKAEVKNIFDSCYKPGKEKNLVKLCSTLPPITDWKENVIELTLKGFTVKKDKAEESKMENLAYATRNKKRLFSNTAGTTILSEVGYIFADSNNNLFREED